jgi:lipopolysaccharide export system protein LptA
MRTLVLAAGVLLLVALASFLAIGKWKNPFNLKDVPKQLGIEIKQESNGVTYTQAHGGHTLFKLHASKVVQLKQGNAVLHDVKIELYGADGSHTDRIEGAEFEYNQAAGTAIAKGPVEITLMRPGVAPVIAPKASPTQALGETVSKATPLASAAKTAASGEIRVRTSGLVFNQKSGTATTTEHVAFDLAQGAGSSMGATYDSQQGVLILDRAVVLNTSRGGENLTLHAQHAEFDRDTLLCHLQVATANYQGGESSAGNATILFREDGSAVRLDADHGFSLQTATGGHLSAPTGMLTFDQHNQPQHGHLEGGVIIDSLSEIRKIHGTAPTMDLQFTARGTLRHAHLERGVEMVSEEHSAPPSRPLHVNRSWRSPVADVDFVDSGHGQVKPLRIHGSSGVFVTTESQRGNEAVQPSRMSADDLIGDFGPESQLVAMTGTGHAVVEQTTPTGTRQTTHGDRLDVHFHSAAKGAPHAAAEPVLRANAEPHDPMQIQSATVDGHVILTQQQAAKPGSAPPDPLEATAGRAFYEDSGEWLHLTLNPRVVSGGLELTADKLDLSQATGDAFAHGRVKATWLGAISADGQAPSKADLTGTRTKATAKPKGDSVQPNGMALGGDGPAHVVATEAQLHQATGEATFRGQARLWQEANSISAPIIILDHNRQTLEAHSTNPADPVRAVLTSASAPGTVAPAPAKNKTQQPAGPSIIRIRGGDLKYSAAARRATIWAGALDGVIAETPTATTRSNTAELVLLPPGNHAGKDGASAQVDQLTASGHVLLTSADRRGTGEKLVYSSESGEYVLTGTIALPPTMTDPARGKITGEALIFSSHDDSVRVEGGGATKTTTETRAPK